MMIIFLFIKYQQEGHAIAQVVSHTGFPPRRPGFASRQSMWGLWWAKWHWGRFSLSTSVSPANHHSTNFSIIIITQGWHNRPIGASLYSIVNTNVWKF
jgi:hypothetical protein